MACDTPAFSISGGDSEASYKETEKTSVMATVHSTKLQPPQAILFRMREDAPPLDLTEDITPTYPTEANYLIRPLRQRPSPGRRIIMSDADVNTCLNESS